MGLERVDDYSAVFCALVDLLLLFLKLLLLLHFLQTLLNSQILRLLKHLKTILIHFIKAPPQPKRHIKRPRIKLICPSLSMLMPHIQSLILLVSYQSVPANSRLHPPCCPVSPLFKLICLFIEFEGERGFLINYPNGIFLRRHGHCLPITQLFPLFTRQLIYIHVTPPPIKPIIPPKRHLIRTTLNNLPFTRLLLPVDPSLSTVLGKSRQAV